MRAEPYGDAEWQSHRRGDARDDGGDPAINRAHAGSEGVVDQVARERLLVLGEGTVKEPARNAVGDLDGGVLVLGRPGGRRLLRSTRAHSGEALVDDAHRAGGDHAADKTRYHAAPDAHESR